MKNFFKIATIGLNSQDKPADNLATIDAAVASASEQGARLIVLPENACLMGNQRALVAQFDALSQHYQRLAKTYDVHILAGTLPCPTDKDGRSPDNGKYYQSSLLFDNQGNCLARYDKIHLFRAQVADGVGSYDEGRTFVAGNRLVVANCNIDGVAVGIGLMICFDVRFAVMAHRLRQLGADILTVPAAFTYATGQAHWQTLLQARALDSQCLVIGATQGGTHRFSHKDKVHTRQTWGHAMVVDANGQVVADAGQTKVGAAGFDIAYAIFDKNKQQQIREHMPLFACHRGNDVYQFG